MGVFIRRKSNDEDEKEQDILEKIRRETPERFNRLENKISNKTNVDDWGHTKRRILLSKPVKEVPKKKEPKYSPPLSPPTTSCTQIEFWWRRLETQSPRSVSKISLSLSVFIFFYFLFTFDTSEVSSDGTVVFPTCFAFFLSSKRNYQNQVCVFNNDTLSVHSENCG